MKPELLSQAATLFGRTARKVIVSLVFGGREGNDKTKWFVNNRDVEVKYLQAGNSTFLTSVCDPSSVFNLLQVYHMYIEAIYHHSKAKTLLPFSVTFEQQSLNNLVWKLSLSWLLLQMDTVENLLNTIWQ